MKVKDIEREIDSCVGLIVALDSDLTVAKFKHIVSVANPILERNNIAPVDIYAMEAFGGKIGGAVVGGAKLIGKGVVQIVKLIPKLYLAIHNGLGKILDTIYKINHSVQGRANWIAGKAKIEDKVAQAAKIAVDKGITNYPTLEHLTVFLGNKGDGVTFKVKLLSSASDIVNGEIVDGADMTKVLKHTDGIMKDSLNDMDLLLKAIRHMAKVKMSLDREVGNAIRKITRGNGLTKSNPVVKKQYTEAFAEADELFPKAIKELEKIKYGSLKPEKNGGFKIELPDKEYKAHKIAWVDGTINNLSKRTTASKLVKHKALAETKDFIKKGSKMPWGNNVKKYESAADFVAIINAYKAISVKFVGLARDVAVAAKNLSKNGVSIDKSLNSLGTKAAEQCEKAWSSLKKD